MTIAELIAQLKDRDQTDIVVVRLMTVHGDNPTLLAQDDIAIGRVEYRGEWANAVGLYVADDGDDEVEWDE